MGVVLSSLSKIELKDNLLKNLDIEFNSGEIIHIQTGSYRIEMTVAEFYELADSILKGRDTLLECKNIDEYKSK